jgi:hypothetical protein
MGAQRSAPGCAECSASGSSDGSTYGRVGWIADVPDSNGAYMPVPAPTELVAGCYHEQRSSRKVRQSPLVRLPPARCWLDLETRLPCSIPTIVVLTKLVPRRPGESKRFPRRRHVAPTPRMSTACGFIFVWRVSGGCNGDAAPPVAQTRNLPVRGDQSSHREKNTQ